MPLGSDRFVITTELERPANGRQEASRPGLTHKSPGARPNRLSEEPKHRKLTWPGVLLAIALAAGGYLGIRAYAAHQEMLRAEETFAVVLDHLVTDQQLNTVLKSMEAGQAKAAADNLRILLCRDIVSVNARLASANDRARAAAQQTFSKMAQFQPKPLRATPEASVHERFPEEVEAQRILALAAAADLPSASKTPR